MTYKMNIPFSPPDISDAEIEEVVKTLKSGWITTGPKVKQFERELANYIEVGTTSNGVPRCVCLNSQTACAEMILHLLGVGPGDEVIAPAYTYTATASVVCHVGAKLVLIDSQKDNTEMDYDLVEKAINKNTKVIIPVSLFGIPCDYDKLFKIVNKKKKLFVPKNDIQKKLGRIAICEDAAHALGAYKDGKMVGNISDFTSFSFHAVKNLTTAEGGALTWRHIDGVDDEEIYYQLQLFSLHGQSKDAFSKCKLGMWEYDIVGTWYKCNMTDIMGAIGLAQFNRYPKMLERRKWIIDKFNTAFINHGVKPVQYFSNNTHSSGHLYVTRVFKKNGNPISDIERREIIEIMANRGVICNVHYKPLPMHTAYKQLGFDIKDFPNAKALYENEITLPLNTCLTDEEVEYIIENFTEVIKEYVGM